MKINFLKRKTKTPNGRQSVGVRFSLNNILKKIYSKLLKQLNDEKISKFLAFIIWLLIDLYRALKNRKQKPKLYGIYGFFGLWGQGKTMSMVQQLYSLRKQYGDDIYIFTNFGFALEDKPFNDWHMLLETYDKSAVFAWDEIQNEFTSRDFKNFPTPLLTILTQNRKGNGIRIYYTAQRFARVDKVFRELTYLCYECKTIIPRLTSCAGYYWEDYEQLFSVKNIDQKIKIKPRKRFIYIQTDFIRSLYNSYQILQNAKNKIYIDRLDAQKLTE